MKIEKRNPTHWLLLAGFGAQCVLGLLMRALRPRRKRSIKTVVLYGHRLNGNLLAIHKEVCESGEHDLHFVFLSMDRSYLDELRRAGVAVCWATGYECALLLSRAEALISDHGLHSLQPWRTLYQRLGMRFFDVWHGMSTMEYRPSDVSARHGYDEIWVASDLYKDVYTTRFGFDEKRVFVTGHARTDRLVVRRSTRDPVRKQYGLPLDRKLVLFAPTWKQQSRTRSIYPFGCSQEEFLQGMCDVVSEHGGSVVMRTHLNTGVVALNGFAGLYSLPASRYPDTEAILEACDVIVCDWSTIVFDWLVLDRPAIFLDVEPPYPLGEFLGDEFRYGEIVDSFSGLLHSLALVLSDPDGYSRRYSHRHEAAKSKFYGGMADGMATRRCVNRLTVWLGNQRPSPASDPRAPNRPA